MSLFTGVSFRADPEMDPTNELEGIMVEMMGRDTLSSLEADMLDLLGETPFPLHDPVIPAADASLEEHVNLPGVRVPDGVTQSLSLVGYLNGQMVYVVGPVVSFRPPSAAPQLNSSTTKRRQRKYQHKDGRPYVKKPLNAFMLFMKDQRPFLHEQFGNPDSRDVTTMLGQMWKAMSSAEQDKYYQQYYRLKRLHYQQHPDWIPNSNKKTSSDWGPGRLC